MLVAIMGVCFFVALCKIEPNLGELFEGLFIPMVPKDALGSLIALVGCIIMPHNLYLHSSLVLSRKIDRENPSLVRKAIYYFNLESGFVLFISFFINLCVISTFANYACKFIKFSGR